MDDALRKRLDAILVLLVAIVALLVLLLVAVGGGQVLVFGVLLALVSFPVGYEILTDNDEQETAEETDPSEEER